MAGINCGRPAKRDGPGIGEVVAVATAAGHPLTAHRGTRDEPLQMVRGVLPLGLTGQAHFWGEGSPCWRAARAAGRADLDDLLHLTATAKRRARKAT